MGTEAKEQVNRGAQNSPTSTLDAMLPGEAAHSTGSLQDYDVQKAVGKGGYSVVYKGTRKKDDRVVAIKKIEVRIATFSPRRGWLGRPMGDWEWFISC